MSKYDKIAFPDPLAPKHIKDTEEFGQKVARAVMGSFEPYKEIRDKRIFEWRKFSEGEQDVQPYLDQLTADGKTLYTNISYKPRPIAKKFEKVVVNGYDMRVEFPRVTALSKYIKDRKERKKLEARYRMEEQQLIQLLSQEVGFPVEDPSAYVPEDEQDLEIHTAMNDKEKEELLMQEIIRFVLNDNDIKAKKRRFLTNMYQVNLSGFYTYIDRRGRLIIEEIDAEDCIYDNSRKEDFSDSSYHGRAMRMTISEARRRFKVSPDKEEELFKAAKKYVGNFGNPYNWLEWVPDYRTSSVRPYDNYVIEVMHLWWKCGKVIGYVEGKDRYGRSVFDIDNNPAIGKVKSGGRKKVGGVDMETAYEGYFVKDGCMVLEWGECKNVLREGYDRDDVISPFMFFMTGNSGKMLTPSLVDRITDSIKVMDLAILKIKQTMAKHPPEGYAIDFESLLEVDLGKGELHPLQLIDIWQQTGNLFYRRRKTDSEGEVNDVPVRPNLQPLGDRLQAYMGQYNAELANIRDYLGVNEIMDGSQTAARVGFRFAEAQRSASNTATWDIYDAWIRTGSQLIKQIVIRTWQALKYGTPNDGYVALLGKENIEFIRSRKELTDTSYDVKFELGMDEGQRQALQARLDASVSAGELHPADAIRIQNAAEDDLKIAEKLAIYLYDKRRKERIKEAQDNVQLQADATAQAGVAVEQAKVQTIQAQAQAEMAKEDKRGKNDQITELIKLAGTIIQASSTKEGGIVIPEALQPIVELAAQSAGVQAQKSTQDTIKQAEAEQLEEQMAMEQMAAQMQ